LLPITPGKTLVFSVPMLMIALQEEMRLPLVQGEGPVVSPAHFGRTRHALPAAFSDRSNFNVASIPIIPPSGLQLQSPPSSCRGLFWCRQPLSSLSQPP
jgi:hypothetical protein